VQRQVVRDLEFLEEPEDALGLRMLGRAVNWEIFEEGCGTVEKGGLVKWVSLTLTSMWWRVGLPSAMLFQLGEKSFEIYHDGMAETGKSTFLRCTKTTSQLQPQSIDFREPKDDGKLPLASSQDVSGPGM
jgi:hypothetical protein